MNTRKDIIYLIAADGTSFSIQKKFIVLSTTIYDKLLKLQPNENCIHINNIDSYIIPYIIDYLNYYKGIPPPPIDKPLSNLDFRTLLFNTFNDHFPYSYISQFETDTLVNIMSAASILGIEGLLDLSCAKMSLIFKENEEDNILKKLNINDSFSDKDRKDILNDNIWLNEIKINK